ncbi:hypothetical protein [Streptomyces bacillaris]|uniref:hypothetical protein n=1 Tax=Streptomyces bacillaris TaxID=68179 RepID=UPI00363FACCE
MDDTPQHRTPGVRYTTETRYRAVPANVFGEEITEYEPYEVDVPVPPRDWDQVLFRFVLAVALASTTVAIVWSTAAIGGLLELLVTAGIAYAAASLFELVWIVCLAAERLLQRTPDRARRVRIVGWLALLVVAGAVIVHGVHENQVAAGLLGGAVSLMAKGSWWVVFQVKNVRLQPRLAAWLQRRVEETAAEEYLLAARQQLGGRSAYNAAVYGSDEAQTARSAILASRETEQPAAIPAPAAAAPPAAPLTAPPAYIAPPVPPAEPSPVPATPVPPAAPAQPAQPVTPITGGSIAATIREVLADTPKISEEDLTAKVRAVHGDKPNLADTVRRTRARIEKKAS